MAMDYDFARPLVNLTQGAIAVAVTGIGLGVILNIALKALGFSKIAVTVSTAIPITIGAVGVVGTIVGIGFFIALAIAVGKSLGRRL